MEPQSETSRADVEDPAVVLRGLFERHDACVLATSSPEAPWVLGAYFAADGDDLVLFLERSGRSIANLRANPRVAVLVSSNDATKDFAQAEGRITLCADHEEAATRARLLAKMPWYKTYTPVAPVRICLTNAVVTSFARGWMPGKRLTMRGPQLG